MLKFAGSLSFAAWMLLAGHDVMGESRVAPATSQQSPNSAAADSLSRDITGYWRDNGGRGDRVIIESHGLSCVEITAPAKFIAVAKRDVKGWTGRRRLPNALKSAGTEETDIIVIRQLGKDLLEVDYARDFSSSPSDHDTWIRSEVSRDDWTASMCSTPYVDELPRLIRRVAPVDSVDARRRRLHGTVMVQIHVEKDGSVKDAKVVDPNALPALNEAALAAVKQYRFKPAKAAGQPIAVWVPVPVKF